MKNYPPKKICLSNLNKSPPYFKQQTEKFQCEQEFEQNPSAFTAMGWYLFYQINWHEYYKIIIKHNSSILTNFIITHICIHTHTCTQISVWYKQIAHAWESRDLNFKFTFSHFNSLYALWSTVPLQSFRSRKEALGLHEFLTIWASSITSLCVHDLLRWGFVELR